MATDEFIAEVAKAIDFWSDLANRTIDGNSDLSWSSHGNEYATIANAIRESHTATALQDLVREICEGLAHSILAIIDGNGPFRPAAIVAADDGEVIAHGALHELLMQKLVAR